MYSLSGMASSSASLRSRAALVFHALASFGSGLATGLNTSSRSSWLFTGARAGAKRSVNRLVIGAGAGTGMAWREDARDAGRGAVLATTGAAAAALGGVGATAGFVGTALAGTFFVAAAALLASVLFNWGLLAWNRGGNGPQAPVHWTATSGPPARSSARIVATVAAWRPVAPGPLRTGRPCPREMLLRTHIAPGPAAGCPWADRCR